MNKMINGLSQGNTPTSSNADSDTSDSGPCAICGQDPICQGLGVVRYAVEVNDPRFGKLYRCPNNPVEADSERQQRLMHVSNLAAFADKSFENFQVLDTVHTPPQRASLMDALQRSRIYANDPNGWLILEGTYGSGKTHLAAAIGNERLKRGDTVLFITSPDLLDHLRSAYSPTADTGYDETFNRVRNAELLILDDLGVENPSQWAQEKLFQLLNHRYVNRLCTVITTNTQIERLDPRISSRLHDIERIHRIQIDAPDFRSLNTASGEELTAMLETYAGMTFENFDILNNLEPDEAQNLKRVYETASVYAQNPHNIWLLFLGPYGSGKTHLASAIANYRKDQGDDVVFIAVPDLMDYLRNTYSPEAGVSFSQRFQKVRDAGLLILDDLGTGSSSNWAKEKLFQIMDYRYLRQLPTLITTAADFEDLDPRIRTRLFDDRRCLLVEITVESYVMRRRRR